jgi:ABC-type sugar transport system permease subunit
MGIALAIALALHRHRAARRAVRALLLLPYAASTVAVALAWRGLFRTDGGLINASLAHLGIAPVDWLGDPRNALAAVLVVAVWMQIGYQVTLFSIGLDAIPAAYGEAARVDGASGWQRFWRVTFPLLRPVTAIAAVTGIVLAAQVFTLIYVLTGGGPARATETIATRIYQTAWGDGRFGEAGALALTLCLILLAATWTELRLMLRRERHA